ncbi:MAG: nucleotidyltransferase family protein [Legionellaceae bacterium]|nr:nucleotidyltransferase family protein [Legionellaceae bacterium]
MVSTAVILAGGLGTRLRSIVHDVPKPMAPIHGRPFLAHQLDYWIAQGIEHFILSVGYKHDVIMDFFGQIYRGAQIDYVVEHSPMGTGGGFLLALEQIKSNAPFLLLNGDTYFDVDLKRLSQFATRHSADWVFSLFYTNDPGRYMGIDVASDGCIRSLKSEIKNESGRLASGGVYWVNPSTLPSEVLSHWKGPVSLEDDIFPALLDAGSRFFGLECSGSFIDIGLPEDYYRSASLLERI